LGSGTSFPKRVIVFGGGTAGPKNWAPIRDPGGGGKKGGGDAHFILLPHRSAFICFPKPHKKFKP